MKKLLLIDFEKEKDSVLKSKLEEMGYPVYSLKMPGLITTSRQQVERGDIIFYAYDETEFNNSYENISGLLNNSSFIFVVKKCNTNMLQNMYRLQNSWYLKEPFEKSELDFTIRMSTAISSLKVSKSEMDMLKSSIVGGTKNENAGQCFTYGVDSGISHEKSPSSVPELSVWSHIMDVAYDHASL
ncbi:MAG: hypothetical protein R2741_00340 [Methanolobus sp.]